MRPSVAATTSHAGRLGRRNQQHAAVVRGILTTHSTHFWWEECYFPSIGTSQESMGYEGRSHTALMLVASEAVQQPARVEMEKSAL